MAKVYRSFDEYVTDYPESERYRAWLTNVAPFTLRDLYDFGYTYE